MTRIGIICLTMLIMVFAPSFALAHPCLCHADSLAAGFAHPLGGPDHLLAMVGVGLWAAQLGGRGIWALPLGFMSALAVGGALGMIGAPIPLVEPGILGSLVAIGLAVALAWRVHAGAGLLWWPRLLFSMVMRTDRRYREPPPRSATLWVSWQRPGCST